MDSKYFLSYSSHDKSFVREVADTLGRDLCFLDEWSLEDGDRLLEKIDLALADPTVNIFVLFWSSHSSNSPWVQEEASQARMRRLLQDDIRILPVLLDDTPRPLWIDAIRWIDAANGPQDVANSLQRFSKTPHALSSSPRPVDSAFQNRDELTDHFENIYKDPHKSILIINGPPGIGKQSLCQFVFQHRLPQLRVFSIDMSRARSPGSFFSLFAARFGLQIPLSVIKNNSWLDFWHDWIFPAFNMANDSLVLQNIHELCTRGSMLPEWIAVPVSDCAIPADSDRLNVVLTTSTALTLPPQLETVTSDAHLDRLTDDATIRALRVMLSKNCPRRVASESQLYAASQVVHGYPIAIQLWAAHAIRTGVDVALLDPAPVQKRVATFVGDVLSKCSLTLSEQRTLLYLSLLRLPMDAELLTKGLSIDPSALSTLRASMLLSPNSQGVSVHELVAEYFVRNRTSHNDVVAAHNDIGVFFKKQWQTTHANDPLSVAYGAQAYYHLLAAGHASDANIIGLSLQDEARTAMQELYRVRRYADVIDIYNNIENNMSLAFDPDISFYRALALSRLDDVASRSQCESVMKDLLNRYPEDRIFWCSYGDVLARWKRNEEAKSAYRQARALSRPSDPVPSARLGELLLNEDRLEDAKVFIEEAYGRAPTDLRTLATYAHLLERLGNLSDAFDLIRKGLEIGKDDIRLNHRAGQILRRYGKTNEALQHLEIAARKTTSPAAYLSLADLYLELGRTKDAEATLNKYPGKHDGAYYNVKGHILLRKDDLTGAERAFARCKSSSGIDVVYCGSMATVHVRRAESAFDMLAIETTKASIVDAEHLVQRGLKIDPNNEQLLRLRSRLSDLRKKALEKS